MDARNSAGVVRVPGWERFGWMRAGFSTRHGGVSSAFGSNSLNLGWKADDEDACVAQNRRLFLSQICTDLSGSNDVLQPKQLPRMVTVRQLHGDRIQVVRAKTRELETETGRAVLEGDGLLTALPGVLLGIQVADCVPVLVADVRRRVVGAFHAGWRGTLARIVERGVARLGQEYGTKAADVVAAVGPSIGVCCYAVGEEVRSGFAEEFAYGAELLRVRAERTYLDLWEANRRQLVEAGVGPESITVLAECSACARDPDGERRFFSHRAEGGQTGRMMGVIGVVP